MIDHPNLSMDALDLVDPTAAVSEGLLLSSSIDEVEVVDPATGEVIGDLAASSAADAESAVKRARGVFEAGPWSRMAPAERAALMSRLVTILETHRDALAEIGTLDVGTPITQSRVLHADEPIATVEWFASVAETGPLGGWERTLGAHGDRSVLRHEPRGVVAALTAFNMPLLLTANKVGAALAAGCSTVLMPSPLTPLSTIAFLNCLLEADLPKGIVQAVLGSPEAGRIVTGDERIDLVSFTGSTATGREIGMQALEHLAPVILELGGSAPSIILPGVDAATVVPAAAARLTRNAGQACQATRRILVPRDQHDVLVAALGEALAGMTIDDPWDDGTEVGPLISAQHRTDIEGYLERAAAAGATVTGGDRPDLDGFYLNPAVVSGADPAAEICQQDIFGPVGIVLPYDTVDEAVAIANGTPYDLNANVWGPADEARGIAARLRAGTVTINGDAADEAEAPWVGTGASGLGVERGLEGFSEYLRIRHIRFAADTPDA